MGTHMGAVLLWCAGAWLAASAQAADVQVQVQDASGRSVADAVVFLESDQARRQVRPVAGLEMAQNHKQFVPQVLIVPLAGFDRKGNRIGYGGGFFDRTLAALQPAPISVGVGFEIARVDDVQPEPHDLPLDWMVTEAGVVVSPAAF